MGHWSPADERSVDCAVFVFFPLRHDLRGKQGITNKWNAPQTRQIVEYTYQGSGRQKVAKWPPVRGGKGFGRTYISGGILD